MKKWFVAVKLPLSQAVCCGLLLQSGYGFSAVHTVDDLSLSERPLNVLQLDQQRGGFLDNSGFKIQIGLEKVVLVDGVVAARSRLVIPEFNARAEIDGAMARMDQEMDSAFDLMDQALNKAATDLSSPALAQQQKKAVAGLASAVGEAQTVVAPIVAKASRAVRTTSGVDINSRASDRTILSSAGAAQSSVHSPVATATDALGVQSVLPPSVQLEHGLTQVLQTNSATLVQNSADHRIIQTFDILNIELSNVSQSLGQKINVKLLPQLMHYSR